MTDTSPATTIARAAKHLRQLVDALGDTARPWTAHAHPNGYPQSVSSIGVPYVIAETYDGPQYPMATAPYIATMHPGVARALAAWLESWTGIDIAEHGPMPDDFKHALAVARLILGDQL